MWPFRNGVLYLPGDQSAERISVAAGIFLGAMSAYLQAGRPIGSDLEYTLDPDGSFVTLRRPR